MAIVEGAFVKTLFPTNEHPREPGLLYICYCLNVTAVLALVAYSSSVPWQHDAPPPPGVRSFGLEEASGLSQRPFVLYLNRLARLPLTRRWFPDYATPSHGVIAIAPQTLRDELLRIAMELAQRRREAIRILGPDRL